MNPHRDYLCPSRAHRRDPLPIDPAEAPRDNEWLLPQLAVHLGCTTGTLRGWLRDRLARARGRTTRVHPRFAEALTGRIPQAQSA